VYVACSTLCFSHYPLDDALRIIGELEFNKMDVALNENGIHLRPSEVVQDVNRSAQRLRVGPSMSTAAVSADFCAVSEEDFHCRFRAVCHLARVSNVSLVTIGAAPAGTSFDAEVSRLSKLTRLAGREGIILSVATRIGTMTESPDTAVALCERVDGLGLTLDPSHYLAGPHQGRNFDQVYPFVRHVHLRDTGRGPNQFQVRIGQGQVEYGRIIAQLARHHYDRILTVDIHDIPDAPYAIDQEVRKLKYLLESLI
jgi:sugar phosphate isomerase/epimerase